MAGAEVGWRRNGGFALYDEVIRRHAAGASLPFGYVDECMRYRLVFDDTFQPRQLISRYVYASDVGDVGAMLAAHPKNLDQAVGVCVLMQWLDDAEGGLDEVDYVRHTVAEDQVHKPMLQLSVASHFDTPFYTQERLHCLRTMVESAGIGIFDEEEVGESAAPDYTLHPGAVGAEGGAVDDDDDVDDDDGIGRWLVGDDTHWDQQGEVDSMTGNDSEDVESDYSEASSEEEAEESDEEEEVR